MTRIVIATSLVSEVIGVVLGTTFYVFQEIVAGLLSIAALLAVGTLLVVIFLVLEAFWKFITHGTKDGVGRLE